MKLAKLIEPLPDAILSGTGDTDITSLCYDSGQAKPGSLFVALRGQHSDGHLFLEEAVSKGASAVLVEEEYAAPRVGVVRVANSRQSMAKIAAKLYGNPSLRMKIAGVTGTNGKTTTVFLLKHILDAAFQRAAMIGTVRYEIGERVLPALHTTPESADIQELMASALAAGCRSTVMEVSSHALMQDRVSEIFFDVGVFTNLTQDHLDYHLTMDEYFHAKVRLFTQMTTQKSKQGHAVINIDDIYGARLISSLKGKLPVTTFGLGATSQFRASSLRTERGKTLFELSTASGRKFLVRMPLVGRFNVYNALGAIAAASVLGVDERTSVKALANAPQVPGRLEAVAVQRNFQVFVDYAHTPDALTNVLRTLREQSPRRIITVFGCGGDRDKAKRPLMARAVEAGSDLAIATSDNPRNEKPEVILSEVVAGFTRNSHLVIVDRKEAIYQAIHLAEDGDIVLIAGKGHENYQEVGGQKFPFSDAEVAGWALMQKPADYLRHTQND